MSTPPEAAVAGDLRDPRRAALPVTAAVGGMVAPAAISNVINLNSGALAGWAAPAATDIAFALAVLAVIGTRLPSAPRTFLLTLAVADGLPAITAIFYPSALHLLPLPLPLALALALLPLAMIRRVGVPTGSLGDRT